MAKYDWYTVQIRNKRLGVTFWTFGYKTTHPNHVALWMVGKRLEDHKILKNDEVVIFPPFFISVPSEVTISTLDKVEKYLISWENNHKSEWEGMDNPTGV